MSETTTGATTNGGWTCRWCGWVRGVNDDLGVFCPRHAGPCQPEEAAPLPAQPTPPLVKRDGPFDADAALGKKSGPEPAQPTPLEKRFADEEGHDVTAGSDSVFAKSLAAPQPTQTVLVVGGRGGKTAMPREALKEAVAQPTQTAEGSLHPIDDVLQQMDTMLADVRREEIQAALAPLHAELRALRDKWRQQATTYRQYRDAERNEDIKGMFNLTADELDALLSRLTPSHETKETTT